MFASYKRLSAPITNDSGLWYLKMFEQRIVPIPIVTLTLTTAVKPFEHDPLGIIVEGRYGPGGPGGPGSDQTNALK